MDITASYIFSHGVGLITSRDLDLGAPTTTQTYTIQDASKNTVGCLYDPDLDLGIEGRPALWPHLPGGKRRELLLQRPCAAIPEAYVARFDTTDFLHLVARHR